MAKINHARLQHRGKPTESILSGANVSFQPRKGKFWNDNQSAKAASPVRRMSREEIAAYAASRGYKVA